VKTSPPPPPPERFFFGADDDGHWYMVPARLMKKWVKWADRLFPWDCKDGELFNSYRLGVGGIESITFENPRPQ
jgi:hypothetical protein